MSVGKLKTSRSTCRRKQPTIFDPFKLSTSNYRRKPYKNENEENMKFKFKARQIPKTHKVPFMVYHSTKNLTAFNQRGHSKQSS